MGIPNRYTKFESSLPRALSSRVEGFVFRRLLFYNRREMLSELGKRNQMEMLIHNFLEYLELMENPNGQFLNTPWI